MLPGMSRRASQFLVGALTVTSTWTPSFGAPAGRVVRVERNRGRAAVPRLCDVQPTAKTGLCVGEPQVGEHVALIDQDKGVALGEFRIESTAAAADPWVCSGQAPIIFKVTGAIVAGDVDAIVDAGRIIGLRNLRLDPRAAKVLKDQQAPRSQDKAELAVDVDGNGRLDYMLVRYGCDEHGHPLPSSDRRMCFDTYLERAGKLERAHQDIIQICY